MAIVPEAVKRLRRPAEPAADDHPENGALAPKQGGALATEAPRDWLLPGADEHFRSAYTRLAIGSSSIVAVCSAIAGEGKTTIAIGLAVTLAQDFPERRVLLVETDLKQPVLAEDFGLPAAPGLADLLQHGEPLGLAVRDTDLPNLQILPGGNVVGNPSRLLRSTAMSAAVAAMRAAYDVVILDVPGLLVSSDGQPVTDLADDVVFVVRSGVTPAQLVQRALATVDEGKLRGTILNGANSAIPNWLRRLCGL